MIPMHPTSNDGQLQQEIYRLQSDLRNKGEAHEIHSLNSRMDSMENSLRELSSLFDGIRTELQVICDDFKQHQEDDQGLG